MRELPQRFAAVFMCVVSTVTCSPTPQQGINDGGLFGRRDVEKVDVFAINRMVRNPKIRQSYVDCFLDKGPCSPEAQNIKPGMVPDAIQNNCQHCTELQRKVIEKMMCYLDFHQPDIMKEIAAKFDPQGEFMKGFMGNILPNGNGQPLNPNLHQPQPQPNPPRPQSNPLPPGSNPAPPQSNPSPPQSQPNPPRPQQNPSQPQQPQNQPQPPQNNSPPQANQIQRQTNQPSQNQYQPHQKTTEIRTSPLGAF